MSIFCKQPLRSLNLAVHSAEPHLIQWRFLACVHSYPRLVTVQSQTQQPFLAGCGLLCAYSANAALLGHSCGAEQPTAPSAGCSLKTSRIRCRATLSPLVRVLKPVNFTVYL